MQFELTEEQRLIQNMAAEFFRDQGGSEQVRAALETRTGYDEAVWQRMSQELGLAGLSIDEAYQGQGLGLIESAVVFEQMGRGLLPSPILGSGVLAPAAIALAGSEAQRQRWLPALASGSLTATLAGGQNAALRRTDEGLRLSGTWQFVIDATAAGLLVLEARAESGTVLVAVPAERAGISVQRHTSLDLTRPYHTIEADDVAVEDAEILDSGAAQAVETAVQRAGILIAAEQTGAAARALELTVQYVGERVQFGRAIGSFQAVKHRLADMMIHVEAAISAVYFAACSVDEDATTLPQMSALAKSEASEALTFCASNMIQLHGGIGFTWEHDAHLYFKRARASSNLFGSVAQLRERIAVHMGLDEEVLV